MLAPDAIAVWHARVEDLPEPPAADQALLSVEERARAARFYFDKDRDLYVLGKRMTRTLLGRELGRAPASLRFAAGARGKPELEGDEGARLAFNLAHSGACVYLALARARRVGVDVERQRESLECLELARRFFCPAEIAMLEAGDRGEARRLFFKYWTLKEAYLKAEGSGLGISLTAMDASRIDDALLASPQAPLEDEPRAILVQRLPAPEGYAAAVAADGAPWRTHVARWRPGDFS